jgi:hypothetical protein
LSLHSIIKLDGCAPSANGAVSHVYDHPEHVDLLVKIIKPKPARRMQVKAVSRYGRRRRYIHLLKYWRCLEEQAAILAAQGTIPAHLEVVLGYVETDLGIGLMVRKETYRGQIAPTLSVLIRQGRFDAPMRRKLCGFLAWLKASPIIVNDLRPENVVLSDARHPDGCFVLIDGYGDTGFLPVKGWFDSVNRFTKRMKIARLERMLGRTAETRGSGTIWYRPANDM